MRLSMSLLLAVLAVACCAQRERFVRYRLTLERAEWQFIQGRHAEAVQAYDSAFALIPFMVDDYFWAVKNALLAGRDDKANDLLVRATENGFRTGQRYDSLVQAFVLSERAMPFLNVQEMMEQRYRSRADTAYITALKQLGTGDRLVEHPDGSITPEKDTTVFERFMRLVEEHGFPTVLAVGDAVHLPQDLFFEQLSGYPDDPRWVRLLQHIRPLMDSGKLPPDYLAVFQDQADVDHGRPMTYGADLFRDEHPLLLASRSKVDKARAAVGLGPIDHAILRAGIDPARISFADRAMPVKPPSPAR